MNGVLIIDKPAGITSFDVVARVRRAAGQRKVGHTGTLDPMATGVLPVCLGDATRLVAYITDGDKSYEAAVRLGAATDTLDRTGKVVAEAPVPALSFEEIALALGRFQGELDQAPPMYSAVRVDGRRLYELAREGLEIERATRRITIHEIALLGVELPELRFRVRCSKGTYVRTLADDLARALGTLGHLTALRRTATAGFDLGQATPLEELERLGAEGLAARLIGPREALGFLPEHTVDAAGERRVRVGQRLTTAELPGLDALAEGARLRLCSTDGRVLAVAERRGDVARYLRVLVSGPGEVG